MSRSLVLSVAQASVAQQPPLIVVPGTDPLLFTVAAVQGAALALARISCPHVPNQAVPAMRSLAHRTALDLSRLLEVLDPDASLRRAARELRAGRTTVQPPLLER